MEIGATALLLVALFAAASGFYASWCYHRQSNFDLTTELTRYQSDPERIAWLVLHGADPNLDPGSESNSWFTPLCAIARHSATQPRRAVAIAEMLLARGADPNLPSQPRTYRVTPLMCAAGARSPEMVAELLAHGAAVDGQDRSGETALMVATAASTRRTVAELLAHGADVSARDAKGETALFYAIWRRNFGDGETDAASDAIIALLVKAGANPDARNARGMSPLSIARHLALGRIWLGRGWYRQPSIEQAELRRMARGIALVRLLQRLGAKE